MLWNVKGFAKPYPEVLMNDEIGWGDDVIPSQFFTRFIYRKWHDYVKVNITFYPPKINEKKKYSDIFKTWYPFTSICRRINIFHSFMSDMYDILWGHDMITSPCWNIHKDWSRRVFQKYRKFQNFITSLYPIFIICTPFCLDFFFSLSY